MRPFSAMKVSITFNIDNQMRRAIENHSGSGGIGAKASRKHISTTITGLVAADLQCVLDDYLKSDEGSTYEEELQIKSGVLEPNYGLNDSRRREE